MKKSIIIWMVIFFLLVASCASAPSIPEWVKKTPSPDSKYTYFVGSSSAKDSATALNDATAALIAGIMQYMGVSISVESSAEAKASLSEYEAQITQTVKTESKGRLSGFEVVEKYIQSDKKTGLYTVHVLARYETKELNKEKARIESLLKEKADAVAIPEQKGDYAANEGHLIDAIRAYAEAMSAAGSSDIENAQIKLERNAKKASALAATLKLVVLSPSNQEIPLGSTNAPSFAVKLITNRRGREEGVPGAPLVVTYPRRLTSGRMGTATQQVFTNQDGIVSFDVPVVELAGDYQVTVQLDFGSIADILGGLPGWALPYMEALESDLSGIRVYMSYKVVSAAKSVPTAIGVYLKDQTQKGSLDPETFVKSLEEALVKEGFSIFTTKISAEYGKPDIAQLKAIAPTQAKRFILATVELVSINKEDSFFIASVTGSLSAIDLIEGNTLYSGSKGAQGMGLSEAEAISAALRTLGGQVFAKELLAALR
ncbi:MAG: hypothetical protein KBB02_00145 [Spirochaetia bacterium]|jgi:hypothetical protein|nr:hypothetical protein [Spirochaetia bacterium]